MRDTLKTLLNKCCSLFLLFFVFTTKLYAQEEPRGVLSFDSGSIVHGHIVDATLHIQSIEKEAIHFLMDSKGKNFLKHFFLVDILETDFINGRLKLRLRLAVRESFGNDQKVFWEYNERKIFIDIEKVNIQRSSGKEDSFKLIAQRVPTESFRSYIKFLFVMAVATMLFFLAVKLWKTRKRKKELAKKEKQDKERLRSLIINMENKEELQQFYENKNKIKNMLISGQKEFKRLMQEINKHQYKDNVSRDQIIEIREQVKKLLENGI